jgi:hypothetical protein
MDMVAFNTIFTTVKKRKYISAIKCEIRDITKNFQCGRMFKIQFYVNEVHSTKFNISMIPSILNYCTCTTQKHENIYLQIVVALFAVVFQTFCNM